MPTCVIIDDEEYSCELLRKKLAKADNTFQVLNDYVSPIKALQELPTVNPDLIFLDIQMPDMSGFDFVAKLPPKKYSIIFITAHDQFALQALKLNALDYLLKPIDLDDLKLACQKFKEHQPFKSFEPSFQEIQHNLIQPRKIILHTAESIEYVSIDSIIRCESLGAYTKFYTHDQRQVLVSKNLGEFEEMLSPYHFFRVHTSHLVNLNYVEQFIKSDGGHIRMSDKSLIEVSRRRKDDFLQAIQKLGAGF